MEKTLEKINQAGIKLLDALTPEETYKAVVKEAISLVDAEYGSVLLEENGKLVRVYASDAFFGHLKIKKSGTIEEAFRKNKLLITNISLSTPVHEAIRNKGIKSVIIIPLSYHNKPIGVLSVLSLKEEHFSKRQVDILRVFGSMASSAIKKAQLYNETSKALEIRDMFISMAAHELRTPLTSLSGYIQLIYNKFSKSDDPAKKWIEALYEENKRMMHLVKEILEVNRLKAGQMQFRWQECDINLILKESINLAEQKFIGRAILFKNYLKTEAKIIADSERLSQAFFNLIDNALRYSTFSSAAEVTLSAKSSYVLILIKDFGRGIDEKDLPNIFEGHHRGGSGEEGFGLGLFFVDNIIRQHKGAINIKSKVKKGTIVEVRLPLSKINK